MPPASGSAPTTTIVVFSEIGIRKNHNDRWWYIYERAATNFRVEKNPDLVALGQNVRNLRREAGLTQEELAARAGLSVNYVGEIERGERNPGASTLFAIARALSRSASALFDGID